MARIPQFEREGRRTGVQSFDAPLGVSNEAVSFQRLQSAVTGFFQQEYAEREQMAMQRQSDRAVLEQSAAGPGTVAQADEGLAFRYQQAFRERARRVHDEQVKLQAQQTAGELRRRHPFDPQGFSQAWGAYVEGQTEAIRAQDPVQAEVVGSYLQEFGGSVYQDLADTEAARERAIQTQEYLTVARERTAALQDELLNNPSEETYLSALSDLEVITRQGVDSGLLEPSQAAAFRDQTRDRYTEEWVRGTFNRSWNAGDLGGAKAVIQNLERGGHFVNNDHGRALARELGMNFKALEGSRTEGVTTANRLLERYATAVELGGELDAAGVDQALGIIMARGSPDQQEAALAKARGAYALQQARPWIDRASVPELNYLRQQTLEATGSRDPAATRAIASAIDRRKEEIQRALDEGDPLEAGGSIPLPTWEQRLQTTDDFERDAGLLRNQLEQRRVNASQATGLMPSRINGLHSNAELESISQKARRALAQGDFDAFDAQVAVLTAPYLNNPREMLGVVSRLAGKDGEVYAAAMLSAMDSREAAKHAISLAAAGKVADVDRLTSREQFDPEKVLGDRDTRGAIDAMAMGDDRARAALERAATDIYYGAGSRGMDRGAARDEVRRIFGGIGEVVEFENGARLPASALGPEYVVEPVKREFARVLEEPQRVGLPPTIPEWERNNLTPRPLGDGSIGIYHQMQGRFLPDPATGRPYAIEGTEAAERQGVEPPDPDAEGWLSWGASRVQEVVDGLAEGTARKSAFEEVRRAGGSEKAAEVAAALVEASKFTPVEDLTGREFDLMLRPDLADEVDWSRIEGDREDLFYDQRLARRVAGDRLTAYEKQFNGDLRAMVAAYWEGPELVRELQAQHGEDWSAALPMSTQQLIGRVESAMERQAGPTSRRERRSGD